MAWLRRYFWTIVWLFTGPGVFLFVVPRWIASLESRSLEWHATPQQWLGLWLLLNGAGLAGWCVILFFGEGEGTPLPTCPPERFVAVGPYRYVRNPMAIGLLLLLVAEACLYGSLGVALYGLVIFVLVRAFILRVEEPDLEKRFGPLYCTYKKQVPRWIPHLRQSTRLDL